MSRLAGLCGAPLLLLALCLLAPRAAHAAESYDNCTGFITSLPAVISAQGTWCMKQDLATAVTGGDAIAITTNNVTLNCNDFKLGGLAAGLGTFMVGVFADGHSNVTVRHCNIRGFYKGVVLTGTGSGYIVEDNRFDNNTFESIDVKGDDSLIRRNLVLDTGQTTNTNYAYGIHTDGAVDVLDNTIANVVATSGGNGLAYGLYLASNAGGTISGNGVRNLVPDGSGTAQGIWSPSSTRITIDNNRLVGSGSLGSTGILCNTPQDRAKDNVINGFVTATINCGDAGGNDITP